MAVPGREKAELSADQLAPATSLRARIEQCLRGTQPGHDPDFPYASQFSAEQLAALRQLVPANPARAAVLVPLVERPEGLQVLLTQRASHLKNHPGQISFPGGRAEEVDASAIETALRETEEEIGLDRRHIEIVGTLPDYVTGTGYRVTPVVALITPPFELTPDANEVAEIFEVPLAFLMDAANHRRLSFDLPEGAGRRSFYAMPYERFFIWGATAGMLRNLFHFLRA